MNNGVREGQSEAAGRGGLLLNALEPALSGPASPNNVRRLQTKVCCRACDLSITLPNVGLPAWNVKRFPISKAYRNTRDAPDT